jgi:hypothetical protein
MNYQFVVTTIVEWISHEQGTQNSNEESTGDPSELKY